MKLPITLLLVFFCLFACNVKEGKPKDVADRIDIKQFISIIKDSSFAEFKYLADKASCTILDSSVTTEGKIIYNAEEDKDTGNTFSLQMTKDFHVDFLHFSTYDKKLSKRLTEQLIELGFKHSTSEAVSEGLIMGNIYVTTISIMDKQESNEYEFVFVRKN